LDFLRRGGEFFLSTFDVVFSFTDLARLDSSSSFSLQTRDSLRDYAIYTNICNFSYSPTYSFARPLASSHPFYLVLLSTSVCSSSFVLVISSRSSLLSWVFCDILYEYYTTALVRDNALGRKGWSFEEAGTRFLFLVEPVRL